MEARYLTDLEWRICHAVNIYVYRNGKDGEQPILVHIPPAKKKNMKSVLNAIQERVKYPVGYASQLYKMDGKKVRHPCELEVYNNYVVASNYDKYFKCAQYGRKKSPLLVLNRDSKHVRVLRLQNQNYHEWMLKKKAVGEERPQFIYPTYYTSENARAQDLPVGKMGNFVPPSAGGTCCQSTGGKTFRVDQEKETKDRKNSENHKEFVVNTCVITNSRKPNATLKNQQESMIKNQNQKGENGEIQERPARKGQLSTKYGVQSMEIHKSDLLNNNVVGMTEEDNLDVVESDLPCSRRGTKGISTTVNSNETGQETTTSEDTLDRKYDDMIRRLKKARTRRRRDNEDPNGSKTITSRKINTNNMTKIETTYQSRHAKGKQMPVLPPPPPQFRDEKGLLPEINVSSTTTSSSTLWDPLISNKSKTMADSPFILADGQLRPQPRHLFHNNRIGIYPQIQNLQPSGYYQLLNGVKSGPLPYSVQSAYAGPLVQQSARAYSTNGFGQPAFGPLVMHNGYIQEPFLPGQTRSIPSHTQSGPSQKFSFPTNIGYSNTHTQEPLYGHPNVQSQLFMTSEGQPCGSYQIPGHQPYFLGSGEVNANVYNLGPTQQQRTFGIQTQGIREERSDAEVDIPYTPMQKGGRTFRVNQNGIETSKQIHSLRKVELDPVKSRNVAIQMGLPGQDSSKTESFTTSTSRNQNSNTHRSQMIPVKVAYYSANGESHLDDAFILQDEIKEAPSCRKAPKRHQPTEPHITSRVHPKTSNAATQINRMTSISQYLSNPGPMNQTGKREYESLPRAEPLLHSNQSFIEYFVSGAQEINSDPMIGDLTTIPPPTEFQEALNHSSRYRSFQNVSGSHLPHLGSSRPDHYF